MDANVIKVQIKFAYINATSKRWTAPALKYHNFFHMLWNSLLALWSEYLAVKWNVFIFGSLAIFTLLYNATLGFYFNLIIQIKIIEYFVCIFILIMLLIKNIMWCASLIVAFRMIFVMSKTTAISLTQCQTSASLTFTACVPNSSSLFFTSLNEGNGKIMRSLITSVFYYVIRGKGKFVSPHLHDEVFPSEVLQYALC